MRRIGSTLKKELLRNKKKSAVLGLLVLVAIYFWVPLVGGWVLGDEPDEVEVAEVSAPAATYEPATSGPKKNAKPQLDWQELLSQRERNVLEQTRHNEWLTSAELNDTTQSPFRQIVDPNTKATKKEEPTTRKGESQLDELELTLTGTIIGRRDRWATINGKTYKLDDLVEIPAAAAGNNEEINEFDVWISRIGPDSVELMGLGHTRELRLSSGL